LLRRRPAQQAGSDVERCANARLKTIAALRLRIVSTFWRRFAAPTKQPG